MSVLTAVQIKDRNSRIVSRMGQPDPSLVGAIWGTFRSLFGMTYYGSRYGHTVVKAEAITAEETYVQNLLSELDKENSNK